MPTLRWYSRRQAETGKPVSLCCVSSSYSMVVCWTCEWFFIVEYNLRILYVNRNLLFFNNFINKTSFRNVETLSSDRACFFFYFHLILFGLSKMPRKWNPNAYIFSCKMPNPMIIRSGECKKFSPNIFNKTKCTNCFKQKEEHSAEALESNRVSWSFYEILGTCWLLNELFIYFDSVWKVWYSTC